jgi:hypothetical protein
MTISTYNVQTEIYTEVANFTNVASIAGHPGVTDIRDIFPTADRIWTRSEGSPSADARYWGLQIDTSSFQGVGAITYDLQADTITGVLDFSAIGLGKPDHISMSLSGEHVVVSWHVPNDCSSESNLGTTSNPCGLMTYNRDFSTGIGLSRLGPHSDIARDAFGNDVIVISNYQTGWVESFELTTGQKINLWNMYVNGSATALHVSGKAINKPGWVLISTYATTRDNQWYTDKIMAVEISQNPRILNIAHTYNSDSGYWTEPHAAVNRDFTKIMYNTNWGSNDEDIDAYNIELPASAVQ